MGKRKSKVVVRKNVYRPKMESSFPCPFCNQETSVECRLDRSRQIGSATCRQCSAGYQTVINYLTEAIDVYGEWIDAIEAQETKRRRLEKKTNTAQVQSKTEKEGFENDELPDLPFPTSRRPTKATEHTDDEADGEEEAPVSEHESDREFIDDKESEAQFTDREGEEDEGQESEAQDSTDEE